MKEIVIIGNVGRTPQVKVNSNGNEFAEFSVAVTESNKSATWFSVLLNGKPKVLEYLTKGKQVYLRGTFKAEIYNNAVSFTLYAKDIQLLGTNADKENDVEDRKPDVY